MARHVLVILTMSWICDHMGALVPPECFHGCARLRAWTWGGPSFSLFSLSWDVSSYCHPAHFAFHWLWFVLSGSHLIPGLTLSSPGWPALPHSSGSCLSLGDPQRGSCQKSQIPVNGARFADRCWPARSFHTSPSLSQTGLRRHQAVPHALASPIHPSSHACLRPLIV